MLRLVKIVKNYKVADSEVPALKGVDLNFRKSEFVSILGPSGCGKTTLLNIIGGLDKYTSGDLFIGGVSTKNFKDHDWDVYRNHKIGFIFQSYNLIPHQTILSNVELALTISGIAKKERQERAKKALDKVGLKGQYNKKPNQLSGGQCQRVAIARALVNEPSILLADEPTGALDTVTSVQIMELIKEISKEKLVIMVTHNPDLAEKYSTRIVRLLDGELQEDGMPFSTEEEIAECAAIAEQTPDEAEKKKEKAKMNLWTAFKLSGRNLISKAKRTVMVALAGCIGIVGISAVMSVSNGVQAYVDSMENDMLSGNPVYISQSAIDYGTLMGGGNQNNTEPVNPDNDTESIYVKSSVQDLYNMSGVMTTNTITKEYIDYLKKMPEENCSLVQYEYGYQIAPNLFTSFKTNAGSHQMSISGIQAVYASVLKNIEEFSAYSSMISGATVMTELPSNAEYLAAQYDVVYMENGLTFEDVINDKSSLIAVVSKSHNTLNDLELAEYGYFSQEEFLNYCYKISGDKRYVDNELMNIPQKMSYETLSQKKFTWYPNDTVFRLGESNDELGAKYYVSAYSDGALSGRSSSAFTAFSKNDSVELNVKCVLKLKPELSYGCLSSGGLYYTGSLSEYIREKNSGSAICESARNNGGELYNIEMEYEFKLDKNTPVEIETTYLSSGGNSIMSYISSFFGSSSGQKAVSSYSGSALGADEFPSNIYFYCNDFAQKDKLTAYLDKWNEEKAANNYKKDKSGFYVGKEVVDGVEKSSYFYYSEKTNKYYRVELSADGYAVDDQKNKYKFIVDEENNDSGFYPKLNDSYGTPFILEEREAWCADIAEIEENGIVVRYCDCNVFDTVLDNGGKTTDLTKHASSEMLQSTFNFFDMLSQTYAEMMKKAAVEPPATVKSPRGNDVYNAYNDFYRRAKQTFNASENKVSQEITYDAFDGVVVGLTKEFVLSFGDYKEVREPVLEDIAGYYEFNVNLGGRYVLTTDEEIVEGKTYYVLSYPNDGYLYNDYLTVLSRLFGYDDIATFTEYTQKIADTFKKNAAGASASKTGRTAYDGAVYTDNRYFVLPYAFQSSVADTVLCYFMVDPSGSMSVWINNVAAAVAASNFEEIAYDEPPTVTVYGRCMLFETPKASSTIKLSESNISVNAYTLASYMIFEKEFQDEENEYVLQNVKGNLYSYERDDGENEYVMKVKNKSFYKLSLDKDGNVLSSRSGYDRYYYDEETNLFYAYEAVDGDEGTTYKLKSTPLTKSEQTAIYAEDTVYPYANVVKNPIYTFNGDDYMVDTKGLYVDMTQLLQKFSVTDLPIRVDTNTQKITFTDYSGIDFYYFDSDDQEETYYYVNYKEETKKNGKVVGYIYGNNASSYLSALSLSDEYSDLVSGIATERYRFNDDGSLQSVIVNIDRSAPLSIEDMISFGVIGAELTDLSILEPDTSMKITYTDNIGLIIAMVNTLIEIITYALIAFTALSLLVSTVMIGIITYVSVVERTKEIGVIRSLGGRKRDVSHLFNAETFIIGLVAGLFGIAITYVICAIINAVIGNLTGIYTIATFPVWQAAIMVGLSVFLTLLSGILPSRSAAKKDPVVALRTE